LLRNYTSSSAIASPSSASFELRFVVFCLHEKVLSAFKRQISRQDPCRLKDLAADNVAEMFHGWLHPLGV
jgi:hypothetical protein